MKKLLFLLTLIVSLASCSKYIYITKAIPPEIILDKQQKRIAFINQFDYPSTANKKERPVIAFQTGVNEFGKTLSTYAKNDSSPSFFIADTLHISMRSAQDTENIMPADTVLYLCKLYKSDLLLVLDSLNFDFTYEIKESESSEGKKNRQAVYYLRSFYYVSLYDSIGLVKRTYLARTMEYATRPVIAWVVPLFEPKNLAKAFKEIKELAHSSGNEYVGMFLPGITTVSGEKLYIGKMFEESNSLIYQKKYDEAIEILTEISTSANAKWAVKAKHNLSVAEEMKKNL